MKGVRNLLIFWGGLLLSQLLLSKAKRLYENRLVMHIAMLIGWGAAIYLAAHGLWKWSIAMAILCQISQEIVLCETGPKYFGGGGTFYGF